MWGQADWGSMIWGGAAPVPLLGPIGLACLLASFLLGGVVLQRRARSRRALLLGTFAMVVVPLSAWAAVTLPHTFTNGTIADATEVNADFSTLEAAANDADARLVGLESPEAAIAPNLLNNWVAYGTPWGAPGFYMDGSGRVHLEGVVKNGTVGASIFWLPFGYRPSAPATFATISGTGFGRIDVGANGNVTLASGGSNTFVSLSGISFRP